MREVTPTRNAALDLADERRFMRQDYEFLDEKRMLLATEMLRQLRIYQERWEALRAELRTAAAALAAAVERHGLDHLQVHPAPSNPPLILERDRTAFLGVTLLDLRTSVPSNRPARPAIDPSPEANACRLAFEQLLLAAAETGARAGNLHRLVREYRRTERRAKALENVLLPELDEALNAIDEQLDSLDREEAIRARWSGRSVRGV